jgi:hypothetical protein
MAKTDFAPKLNGFHFGNYFVNNILQIPVYGQITSLGRCGGMSFSALDFYFAHQMVPRSTNQDFAATGSVPPDGTPLADYIYRRQIDSFLTPSAAKFVTWSVTPDGPSFLLRGVDSWTKQDEYPKLRMAIDAGKPVPLGLVVATDLSGLPHNHQVVAYGYDLDATGKPSIVYIYDNNHPDQEVTLTARTDSPGWAESTGEQWRGFFIQDYTPQSPPAALITAPVLETAVEKSLLPATVQPVTVTFDTIRFNGDEQLLAKGRVALTFSVNDVAVRWPRSGTRIVKADQLYDINKSLEVEVQSDAKLVVKVRASEELLDSVHIVDNDVPGSLFAHEYGSAKNWGKGRHKENVEAVAGGYTVKYTIKPHKAG